MHGDPFPDNFDPVDFISRLAQSGHNRMINSHYLTHGKLPNGTGWVDLALPYDERLVGDTETGILASGPIFTMMDMATTIAIWMTTGSFQPQATLDLRIDYLRPATPGKTVIGHGECYHLTKSIAFVRGHAHEGDVDKPIAHVAGTYFFTASS
jgi:uncharacterized protein (TIGR00369 family)